MIRVLKPCGTPAAYKRHLRHGEAACAACLEAEAARQRPPGAPPFQPAQHGTKSKYNNGCRCEPCITANREACYAWRASVAGLADTVPELITHGASAYRNYGCRCAVCTAANTKACREYDQRCAAKAAAA